MATLKVILLGSQNAGKTSILNRYIKNTFYEKSQPTVGVDFESRAIAKEELASFMSEAPTGPGDSYLLSGENVQLQIWDTTGQEMFKSMNKLYFRGSQGVVLVCDLTDVDTFTALDGWFKEFTENCGMEPSECAFVLLGNKSEHPN